MTLDGVVLPADWPMSDWLERRAETERMILVAGLPGVGKSLLVQQLALLGHRADRRIHLLQWDVARAAFETADILARYPEIDGFTHAAVKKAVGLWAREAVFDWDRTHPDPADMLIAESALIGGRMSELVEPMPDPPEAFLATTALLCLVPVPTRAVRAVIEQARALTIRVPTHQREQADAAPNVLQALWEAVHRLEDPAGPSGGTPIPYDPAVYARAYRRMLAARRTEIIEIDRVLEPVGSVYQVGIPVHDLRAEPAAVAAIMKRIDTLFDPSRQES